MSLVEGVHRATFLTEDLDRAAAFYERVLDARKTLDLTEEGVRHVFLEVGPTTVLQNATGCSRRVTRAPPAVTAQRR